MKITLLRTFGTWNLYLMRTTWSWPVCPQYESDSPFSFYDPVPPPPPCKEFTLLPGDPLSCLPDVDTEQSIDLMSDLHDSSPLSSPSYSQSITMFNQSVTMVVSHTTSSNNRPPSVVRNLSPYFVSQPAEVEFAPSPASSSSSITSDPELSYTTGYIMSGVQDLPLYTNNHRFNLQPFEERINCSFEEEHAQDWENISGVMGLGITLWEKDCWKHFATLCLCQTCITIK